MKKLRILLYILKQGFLNIFKNFFMIFASICVITVSLFILGTINLTSLNLQGIFNEINKKPEILISCKTEATDNDVKTIEDKIKKDSRVESVVVISKTENFKKFLEYFKDNKDLFTGYKEDFLYVSFNVKMKNPEDTKNFVNDIKKNSGIDKVDYSWQLVTFLTTTKKSIKLIGSAGLSIMAIISILLIVNTLKLTAYARRKELEIMKYVGASDSYIRGPFIFEGIFIGIISALLAFYATRFVYVIIAKALNDFGIKIIQALSFKEVGSKLLLEFCIAGVLVCIIGIVVSIRKYIKV